MPNEETATPQPPDERPDISLMTPLQLAGFAFAVLRDIDRSKLRKGAWINPPGSEDGGGYGNLETVLATPTQCTFCAVGAVLLANGIETAKTWVREMVLPETEHSTTNAAFLRGLSRAFEAETNPLDGRHAAMDYALDMIPVFRDGIAPETVDPHWHSRDCVLETEDDDEGTDDNYDDDGDLL